MMRTTSPTLGFALFVVRVKFLALAHDPLVHRMRHRRVTSTTMVLAILADTTEPTFSFLIPGLFPFSACYALSFTASATFLATFWRGLRLPPSDDSFRLGFGRCLRSPRRSPPAPLAWPVSPPVAAAPLHSRSRSTVSIRARSLRSARSFFTRPSAPSTSGTAAGTSAPPHPAICLSSLGRIQRPGFFRILFHVSLLHHASRA